MYYMKSSQKKAAEQEKEKARLLVLKEDAETKDTASSEPQTSVVGTKQKLRQLLKMEKVVGQDSKKKIKPELIPLSSSSSSSSTDSSSSSESESSMERRDSFYNKNLKRKRKPSRTGSARRSSSSTRSSSSGGSSSSSHSNNSSSSSSSYRRYCDMKLKRAQEQLLNTTFKPGVKHASPSSSDKNRFKYRDGYKKAYKRQRALDKGEKRSRASRRSSSELDSDSCSDSRSSDSKKKKWRRYSHQESHSNSSRSRSRSESIVSEGKHHPRKRAVSFSKDSAAPPCNSWSRGDASTLGNIGLQCASDVSSKTRTNAAAAALVKLGTDFKKAGPAYEGKKGSVEVPSQGKSQTRNGQSLEELEAFLANLKASKQAKKSGK